MQEATQGIDERIDNADNTFRDVSCGVEVQRCEGV